MFKNNKLIRVISFVGILVISIVCLVLSSYYFSTLVFNNLNSVEYWTKYLCLCLIVFSASSISCCLLLTLNEAYKYKLRKEKVND